MIAPTHALLRSIRTGPHGEGHHIAEVYRQCAPLLVALAKRRLGRYLQARIDPEDIVQNAFVALLQSGRSGVPQIQDADALQRMLSRVVVREIHHTAEYHRAQKRNIRRDLGGNAVFAQVTESPTPLDATASADGFDRLFRHIPPGERQLVQLRLYGHRIADIARMTRRSRWTVRRALNRIGQLVESRL